MGTSNLTSRLFPSLVVGELGAGNSTGAISKDALVRLALEVMGIGLMLLVVSLITAALGDSLFATAATGDVESDPLLGARLFRLGRVASMALPLLTLLAYPVFAGRPFLVPLQGRPALDLLRVARVSLAVGMVTMPTFLLSAAFVDVRIKYLLTIPSVAFTSGILIVAFHAWHFSPRGEAVAWAILAASLTFGLVLGTFAFEGPIPVPGFLDGYNDTLRVWFRSIHNLSIVGVMVHLAWARLGRPASSGAPSV